MIFDGRFNKFQYNPKAEFLDSTIFKKFDFRGHFDLFPNLVIFYRNLFYKNRTGRNNRPTDLVNSYNELLFVEISLKIFKF